MGNTEAGKTSLAHLVSTIALAIDHSCWRSSPNYNCIVQSLVGYSTHTLLNIVHHSEQNTEDLIGQTYMLQICHEVLSSRTNLM